MANKGIPLLSHNDVHLTMEVVVKTDFMIGVGFPKTASINT